jgi:hypothetical protein
MNSLFRRLYYEQDGQVIYLAAATLVVVLGMAALSIDIGYALHCQRELQSCADEAASAGGSAFTNANSVIPTTVADEYSGDSASPVNAIYNIHHDLNNMTVTVNYACVTGSTATNLNLPPCVQYSTLSSTAGCTGGCNVIQVVETATVPTFFAKVFGISSIPITATASASASGALPVPYHIMMVLDTTASMGSGTDTGCTTGSGTYSPEQCAQIGVQTLLNDLAPCAANLTSCGSSPAVDKVGMMVFPGTCGQSLVSGNCPGATTLNNTAVSQYASDDISCPATDPPITSYNNDPAYLIVGFDNDYRTSDAAATLNYSDPIVESVGAASSTGPGTWVNGSGTVVGSSSCGMPTPGGEGTFYAGAIISAQAYLTNNHTTGVQDIMILLSDGNASASSTQMGGTVNQSVTFSGMNGKLYSSTAECTQAVNAAHYAKTTTQSDGTATEIYSISYGSETSGCTSGESVPAIAGNTANTPCATMAGIASAPLSQYFFSVPQTVSGKTSTTCSGAVPITTLDQVFTTIAGYLTSSRLIPNADF